MLGPPKLRLLDQPVSVALEELVPPDNFYRHLDAVLDLSYVRTWVRDCYAEQGRPSIDPVVFFKLQLIMFFEGLRSERKLMETVALNLAHRWYLGYNLNESLPDHSSLTRIRARLGLPLFERFFGHVVDLCQQVGLVWGAELFFDGTKVRANADIDSLVPRWYAAAKAHLDALFSDDGPPAAGPDGVPTAVPTVATAPPADANIFLRHFRQDHADHSPRATAFLQHVESADTRARTADPIIFETVFTLERTYKQPRSLICDIMVSLLSLPTLVLPNKRRMRRAFALYLAHPKLSFGDCYHVALMESLGLTTMVSFDRAIDQVPTVVRAESDARGQIG